MTLSNFMEGGIDHEEKRTIDAGWKYLSCFPVGRSVVRIGDQVDSGRSERCVAWGPVHALQPWVKKVEDATKGRVKIEIFPAQTLVKGPDIWNAVKTGVADMGWCFHGYWADMTPLSDVITLPSLPIKSSEKGSEVLWKLYERFPAIQNESRTSIVLQLWASNPYFLITTKKQVKTMEDMKGLKIRVVAGPPTDQMRALGAVPTPIPCPIPISRWTRG